MASLNKVLLIGNLTRDPELRYIPSGSAVATFTLAVNRFYTTQTGEKKEQTSFIRIVVWGRRAEVCGEYLSKGSPVFVEGRLQSRDWQTQDGQKRNTVEVIADNIQFLRAGAKQGPAASAAGKQPSGADEVGTIDLNDEIAAPQPEGPKAPNNAEEEAPF
ncbi:MAG: single-stranded DNA-binding protein [Candidatus Omnitrophota bacterium]